MNFANDYRKPKILKQKASVLTDIIWLNYSNPLNIELVGYKPCFDLCISLLDEAISLAKKTYKNPNQFIVQSYALKGLAYQYNKSHDKADNCYQTALSLCMENDRILFLNEFNTVNSWSGWNKEEHYKATQNQEQLEQILLIYEKAVLHWETFKSKFSDAKKGINDGYKISTYHKIPNVCYQLFRLTNDSSYIDKALYYANQDLYPTYHQYHKSNFNVSVKAIQPLLTDKEHLVMYFPGFNPNVTHAVIISNVSTDFIHVDNRSQRMIYPQHYEHFNGQTTIEKFKEFNYRFYQQYFKKIDSVLTTKNAQNIIVVPGNGFSQLNFELLISDTNHHSWKTQPYLFHKYNFSYALNLSTLANSVKTKNEAKNTVTTINGNFNQKTNLLFSDQLVQHLSENYNSTSHRPTNANALEKVMQQNAVCLLVGHGYGSFSTSNSNIHLTDSFSVTANSLMDYKINNELVITTACSSNQSDTYISEGSTSGFSKALKYAGVKATLTTNWEIDDKTNATIIKDFFALLKQGYTKSEALWKAKKTYWNKCQQTEEFHPKFWAAYRLTGNTQSINLTDKRTNNYYWLLLLIIPLGIYSYKKVTK